MKKLICLVLALIFVLAFAGCGDKENDKKESKGKNTTATEQKNDETAAETVPLKTTINELVTNAAKCTTDIFYANTLAYNEEPVKGNLCPVEDKDFSSYEKLEEFVRNVYVKEVADDILAGTAGGSVIYTDVAGTLCIDTQSILARGYFVDWSNFTVSEPQLDDQGEKCTFTVTASVKEPGDSDDSEPYELEVSAAKIDGKWLLETIVK